MNKLCPYCHKGKGEVVRGSSGDVYIQCGVCGAHTDSVFGGTFHGVSRLAEQDARLLWRDGYILKSHTIRGYYNHGKGGAL